MVGGELPGVLQERHAAVFVADDEVDVAVLVPVERHGRDHLEVHRQGPRRAGEGGRLAGRLPGGGPGLRVGTGRNRQASAWRVAWLGPRPDVFVVGEAIEELAAEHVEVAVAIEVREVRRRPAEGLERSLAGVQLERLCVYGVLVRAFVARDVDETAQRPAGPVALRVVGIVPAVIGPVADADREVVAAIAVEIDHLPQVGAHLVRVHVGRQRQRTALGQA